MKSLIAVLSLMCFCAVVHSQATHTRAETIQHFCNAPEVTSGPEFDCIVSIRQRLAPVLARVPGHEIHVAVVESDVINVWDSNLNGRVSLICIPTAFIRFMGESEGEMAFIYAHEVGHALDNACKSAAARAQMPSATLGGELDRLLGAHREAIEEQRTCEARADGIGFRIFTAAGYNPFDAAGGFGRLEMYLGDTSTGVIGRLAALGSNHPITPDRIRHMRALLIQELRQQSANQ